MALVPVWIGHDGFPLKVPHCYRWGVRLGTGGDGDNPVNSPHIYYSLTFGLVSTCKQFKSYQFAIRRKLDECWKKNALQNKSFQNTIHVHVPGISKIQLGKGGWTSIQDWNIPKRSKRNFWMDRFDFKKILKGFKYKLKVLATILQIYMYLDLHVYWPSNSIWKLSCCHQRQHTSQRGTNTGMEL